MTVVLHTIDEARAFVAEARSRGQLGLVPTMGALHDGHLSLVRLVAERVETVVVSIFVNPMQFGPNEDLERYPRTFDDDLAKLEASGVAAVFAPSAAEMYPRGLGQTRVVAGPAGSILEGERRPGHFDGVLTVVAKLFGIVRPDIAVFGRKDAQQLHLIERMADDLDLGIEILGAPILRADDGVALSSRNVFLAPDERAAARSLPRALEAAAEAGASGGRSASLAAGRAVLDGEPLVTLDYLEIVDPDDFAPVDDTRRGTVLVLVAARVGATRLIDNTSVDLDVTT